MTEPLPTPPPAALQARPVRTALSLLWPVLVIVALLLVLLAGIGGGLRWLLATEPGTAWLLQQLPMVQAKGFQGALLGERWRADSLRVEWDSGRQWLLIEKLEGDGLQWQWRPQAKAWVGVEIGSLRAQRLSLELGPPSGKPPTLPARLDPPVQLNLGSLQVDEVKVDGQAVAQRLRVQGLRLDPGLGARHVAESLALEARGIAIEGTFKLDNSAPFSLDAQASLRPAIAGDQPPWAAVLRAGGSLKDIALDGTLRGRPLPGRNAPVVDLKAALRPFEPWAVAGLSLQTEALDLSALQAQLPSTRLSGKARLDGGSDGKPLTVALQLKNGLPGRWNENRLPVAQVAIDASSDPSQPDRLQFTRFEIDLADALRAAGRLSGEAVWQGHELQLDVKLANVTPQRLDSRAAAMSLGGPVTVTLRGLPSPDFRATSKAPALSASWKLDLQGRLEAAPQLVRLQVEGNADESRLQLDRVRAESGAASAELAATVARAERGDWQVGTEGQVRDFDPLAWWPGEPSAAWRKGPHRLNGDWKLDLRVPGNAATLAPIELAQRVAGNGSMRIHDAQLAGVPLTAAIRLAYGQPKTPEVATVTGDLSLGGNQVLIEGRGDPLGSGQADRLRLELKGPNLAGLGPLARLLPALAAWAPTAGTLNGSLSAEGRWPALRSEGELRLSQLKAGTLAVASGNAKWQLASSGGGAQTLQLDLVGMALGPQRADHLRLDASGTLAEHRIEVNGAMPLLPPAAAERVLGIQGQSGTRGQVVVQGQWQTDGAGGGRYRARVDKLVVGSWDGSAANGPPASGWATASDLRAELVFSSGRLASLRADPGRLQVADALALRWDAVDVDLGTERPRIQLRAELEPFAVAPLLARAQPKLGWGGNLRIGARIEIRAAEKMDADIVLERRDGDLQISGSEGATPQAFGLSELRLAITAHEGVWAFTPLMRGSSIGDLAGLVQVRTTPQQRWPEATAPIGGGVHAEVADLGIWSGWVPPGWRLGGRLSGTASLAGTFGGPEFNGVLSGSGLAARNLLQGVNISDGQVEIRLNGETATVERFTLRGGDGSASITGDARLGALPQADLKFTADRFRVLGRIDRMVTASGKLDIALRKDQARVDGKIRLDEMIFDGSRSDAPSLDDDVTVRRPGGPQNLPVDNAGNAAPFNLALNVEIDLGKKARFKGWGIDTGLSGSLRLTSPNSRPAVNGTISTIGGTFANYGQKLVIERGIIAFNGNVGNPRLDVVALRPNLDVRVGVTVTGNLLTLRVRLYSDPEMSENDKLAWLMLGRAPDGLGRNETALLQRAAVALLSGDGEAPTDALLKSLGIDDLGLRQSDGETRETVVTIGKRLSDRWYLGYERGVNATTGTWQLIYRIAQRFTLRLQSGYENAVDVIWTWRVQETPADAAMRKSKVIIPP